MSSTSTFNAMSTLPPLFTQLEAPLSHTAVFDALQKEFCPLLDSTLVAALLADIDFDQAQSTATGGTVTAKEQQPIAPTTAGGGSKKNKRKNKRNSTIAPKPGNVNGNVNVADSSLTVLPERSLGAAFETSLQILYDTLRSIAASAQAEADEVEIMAEERDASAGIIAAQSNLSGMDAPAEGRGIGNVVSRSRSGTVTSTTTTTSRSVLSSNFNGNSGSSKRRKPSILSSNGTGMTTLDTRSTVSSASASASVSSPMSPQSYTSSSHSSSSSSPTPPLPPATKHALLFLQAALPHIPTRILLEALERSKSKTKDSKETTSGDREYESSDEDMWTLISSLLNSEDVREMDERGLTDLSSPSESGSYDGSNNAFYYDDDGGAYYDDDEYAGDYAHAHALEKEEQEESRRYLAQMDEDEKMARELALEMELLESEERNAAMRVYNKKDAEEEEWVTAKRSKNKAGQVNGKTKARTVKITLNDVRQQQQIITTTTPTTPTYRPRAPSSAAGSYPSPPSSLSDTSDALSLLLPSLATYLSALLPRDKAPSALLISTLRPLAKGGEATTTTYIQNVFLNERALRTRFAGRVYLAVRACLEQVVKEASLADNGLGRLSPKTDEPKEEEEKEEGDVGEGQDGWKGDGNGGPRNKERRKARPLPPEDTPHPPPRKAKSRVRTATDRPTSQECEPGGSGSASGSGNSSSDGADEEEDSQTLLLTLLDILLPEYALVDGEARVYVEVHQLLSDIELCIGVTSVGEDALDLTKLLCELYVSDADPTREMGRVLEMFGGDGGVDGPRRRREGVSYAEAVGARKVKSSAGAIAPLVGQAPLPKESAAAKATGASTMGKKKHKPSPYQWQAVPTKKFAPKPAHTILPHLPTYTRDVNGTKQKEEGPIWLKGMEVPGWVPPAGARRKGAASEYEEAEREYRHKIRENMRRRDELLHEAARMYNRGMGGGERQGRGRGTGKVRGGDVAWYFAERAREFQEAARKESLNAARAMVLRKQVVTGERDTVDLHGTTVTEAVGIVLEMLEGRERGRPLKIITGRGSHSASGMSVLKPAIKKRLVQEGWSVGAWDAGLVVR